MDTETKNEKTKELVPKVEQPEIVENGTDANADADARAKELSDIEGQLVNVWQKEMKLWVQTYLLMKRVEDEKLYEAKGHRSFSAWVNALASEIIHVQASLLWKRLKAGRAYSAHVLRVEGMGIKSKGTIEDVKQRDLVEKKLTETNLSPDSLVLIDKITNGNPEEADKLIEKAEAGELRNRDLKEAWQEVKEAKAEKRMASASKGKTKQSNPSSSGSAADADADGEEGRMPIMDIHASTSTVTAKTIVDALKDSLWMQKLYKYAEKQETPHETPTFRLLTEFPVYPPETRQPRRIDALICENYSVDAHIHDEVVLHGIEIKVSKSDLVRDTKMGDYALYVDCMWVAVPDDDEIVKAARDYIADGWGLLVCKGTIYDGIVVDREAKKNSNSLFRDKAMQTLARKLIKMFNWS